MRGFLLLAAAALAAAGADLSVRKVVLYKHGVGYFERSGDLAAGQSARLDFKAAEMDDVLKSLTISEAGGGRITGLRYDSSEPLDKKLSEYPFQLAGQLAISAFLDQLKGSRVEVRIGGETVAGAIVSGRTAIAAKDGPQRELLAILADSGDLRTLDLSAATSLRLVDPALGLQLKDYLAAVAGSRNRDKRSVYVDSTDTGSRKLFASYMIPTPVWKSSYRLVFKDAEPTIEGWAIVDNTTGDDWTNIQLALVSGRPISFVNKLYEPKYILRPSAELPEDRVTAPVVHEGGLAKAPAPPPPPMAVGAMRARPEAEARFRQSLIEADERRPAEMAMVASSVAPETQARELGDLFEYRFSHPVTVRKNESAMLPFLHEKIAARKLLIYTSGSSSQHPMTAAELTNSTGKTLDGGPITIFDAGAYAGEALMETLKNGDKRLISYGIDLGARVTTKFDSRRATVREVHMKRGVVTARAAAQETITYSIRNVDAKPKTLVIEQGVRPETKVINQKPSETTASAWRFEVRLAAGGAEQFPVTLERVYDETYAVASLTPDVIVSYVQNKAISEAARIALDRILAQKRLIADTDNRLRQTDTQVNELGQDQDRIRRNISSLNSVAGQQEQVQKYARALAAQETQLAALRDQQAELRRKKSALESELNSMIEKLEF